MMTQHIIDADKLEKLEKFSLEVVLQNDDGDKWVRASELRALIANSPQADGMVLVPKTPSDEMLDAGRDIVRIKYVNPDITAIEVYKAMLSAYKPQADDVRKDDWISVEDRLPLWDGVSISYLTVTNDAWYRICEFNGTKFPSQVTHWQPLPAPPLDKARE